MESGTTPPPQKWPGVRADFLHVKKKVFDMLCLCYMRAAQEDVWWYLFSWREWNMVALSGVCFYLFFL